MEAAENRRQNNIIVEVTQECNHFCLYCYNVWLADENYPRGILNTADTKRMLDKIIEQTGCKTLTFSGGEPLLREDIPELVKYVKNRVNSIILISNGSLLTKEKIKELVEAGVDLFELTLLSSDRKTLEELKGVPDYENILDAVIGIKEAGAKVVTVFVATKKNLDELEDVLRLNIAIGTDGIMFNRVNIGGSGIKYAEELMPAKEDIEKALELLNIYSKRHRMGISCSIPMMPCIFDMKKYPELNYGFCLGGKGEDCYYTFDPMGNVRICNHSNTILGNIFEKDFKSIVQNEYVSCFREQFPGFCKDCNEKSECQAGCRASAEVTYGNLAAEEPFLASVPLKSRKKP